jgi:hypothetical protein
MNTETEHWDMKNGDLAGVWAINPLEAKGADMWQIVEEIVMAYVKLHPLEVEFVVRSNKQEVETKANDFGSTENESLRWSASLPAGLMFKIQQVYPEIFTDKTLYHKFLKKHPGFLVCKTI